MLSLYHCIVTYDIDIDIDILNSNIKINQSIYFQNAKKRTRIIIMIRMKKIQAYAP